MCFKTLKTVVLSLLLGIFACCSAFAADGTGLKIGIMNVQKVLVQSDAGLKAKKVFEKRKTELEAQFATDQKKLEEMQAEIEKKTSVWPKETKEEKILEFNKMRRDLQTKTKDASMEMKMLQDKELEPIIKELEKVVDAFGEKEGYSIILDSKNGVVFYAKAYDISDALIAELNKVMK